jgi:chorismate mutase
MPIRKFVPLAALICLASASCTWAQTGANVQVPRHSHVQLRKLDYLLGLMRERLELSRLVAEVKWNQGLPIEDLERERQFLRSMQQASQGELNPGLLEAFFLAQIQASKELQKALFEEWRSQSVQKLETSTSLEELRPRLDRVSVELLHALRDIQPTLRSPQVQSELRGFPVGALGTALKPLIQSL